MEDHSYIVKIESSNISIEFQPNYSDYTILNKGYRVLRSRQTLDRTDSPRWLISGFSGDIIPDRFDGTLRITNPFELHISFKDQAVNWSDGLKSNDRLKYLNLIQAEVDKIFAVVAERAAMIIDQQSYDDTPERYMLVPLLMNDMLCERYGVTPILKYGSNNSIYIKDCDIGPMNGLLDKFNIFPSVDFFMTRNDGVLKLDGIRTHGGSDTRVYPEEVRSIQDKEILAKWGLLGKTEAIDHARDPQTVN